MLLQEYHLNGDLSVFPDNLYHFIALVCISYLWLLKKKAFSLRIYETTHASLQTTHFSVSLLVRRDKQQLLQW